MRIATQKRRWALGAGGLLVAMLGFYLLIEALWLRPSGASPVIPSGTAITVRLATTLTSQSARLGEAFEAEVVSTAAVRGQAPIPPGTRVEGRCIAVRQADSEGRAGYLRLVLSGLRDTRGHWALLETTTLSELGTSTPGPHRVSASVSSAAQPVPLTVHGPTSGGAGTDGDVVVTPQEELTFVLLKPVATPGRLGPP